MDWTVYASGLAIGLGLIMAIGAQNAFVLRQGLRGEHVFAVCLTCALADAMLILAGVAGFGRIGAWLPWLEPAMRIAGALFLVWFGLRSALSALRPGGGLTVAEAGAGAGLVATLAACLAVTLLNPHVYLDTVVMLGTIAAGYSGREADFAAGAITGSLFFFFALGYGAAVLRPVFARPAAWRALDAAIAVTMWAIAVSLATGA